MADDLARLQQALAAHYAVNRAIGSGGMATVYLAHDRKHDRPVALKVLRPELALALGPERFLREIRLTARLDHPYILPLLDSGDADGLLYYVMPYVEGEALRDRLDREGQLSLEAAVQIAREVAGALAHAHGRGIVHRDIKPENILLSGGHARVADFGIARAVSAAGGDSLTETGLIIGTPAYMSPEQAAGQQDLDGRSDTYALGCVLYEMLAGHPPFTGGTAREVLMRHTMDAVPSLTAARPLVTTELEHTIARALAKTPADRFSSAVDFAEALARPVSQRGTPSQATRPPGNNVRRFAMLGGTVLTVIIVVFVLFRSGRSDAAPAASTALRTAIAVLPFENLSTSAEHAYFAGGLHDELLTQLSKVAALKVISRTSVMGYADRALPLKQVAGELGVGSIVEGSVQVVGNRLRVNVQLIDAATDAHLWAERYDRDLDDAFAIQSDIARQVVAAVGAALSRNEQQGIAAQPTSNAEAYRSYLQGREYFNRASRLKQDYETALQLYQHAVALDSTFALAYVALAEAHSLMYVIRYDPSPARVELAREAAEAALRLAPELPEAKVAISWVYGWGQGDQRRALDTLLVAARGLPNDARVWQRIGFAHRRLGNWNEAVAAFDKATRLNPRDADLFHHAGITFDFLHRYDEAIRDHDVALRLAPDLNGAKVWKGWAYARWKGQLDSLHTGLSGIPEGAPLGPAGDATGQGAALLLWERNPDSLQALLARTRKVAFEGELYFKPVALYAGWAHRLRGNTALARTAFAQAVAVADSVLARLPEGWPAHVARGLALAGLGRSKEAMDEARWIEQSRFRTDAYFGPLLAESRAAIFAELADAAGTVAELEKLLAVPSWVTVQSLRLDPRWDPIRNDQRFQALVKP